jgi:predicted amidohydrolase YtcJ
MSPRPLLLRGARVITMDPARPRAEAVGVRDGLIAVVGSEPEVRSALGPDAEEIELDGGALLPAFIDAHHHFSMAVFDLLGLDLKLPAGSGIDDLLEVVARAAKSGDGWLRGYGYDVRSLREQRPPRLSELDEACPDRPLLLIAYSFHEGCLNSRGLEEMGWSRRSSAPTGGRLERDRLGRLTGEVGEAALHLAEARSRGALLPRAEDAWLAECEAHGRRLLAAGITRVGDAAVPPDFERLYQRALSEGRLPVTVHRMPVSGEAITRPRLDTDPTGSGPDAIPAGPAKLILDGADRCSICVSLRQVVEGAAVVGRSLVSGAGLASLRALRRSGSPRLGRDGHLHTGTGYWDEASLSEVIGGACEAGLQVAQHAVGNEASALAVRAAAHHADHLHSLPGRPRLEHLVFVDASLPREMAAAGLMAVVQPRWVHDLGDSTLPVPLAGSILKFPLRSLSDAGVDLVLSSDYPAAGYEVLPAIESAVTRRTAEGELFGAEEALTVEQALAGYTIAAARALGVEDEAGSIEPGRRADLVVLSVNPLTCPPDELAEIGVSRTYLNGDLAFDSRG